MDSFTGNRIWFVYKKISYSDIFWIFLKLSVDIQFTMHLDNYNNNTTYVYVQKKIRYGIVV